MALAEEAVRSRKEAKESDEPNYLMSVENLNEVLHTQSYANDNDIYQQVLPRWEKWYSDWEKTLGFDHQHTQRSLSNLTASLRFAREREAVREIHQRMLSTKEKTLGADHPSTESTREVLRSIEQNLGCYKKEPDGNKNVRGFLMFARYKTTRRKARAPVMMFVTKKSMRNRVAVVKNLERRAGPEHPRTVKAREALWSALRRSGAEQEAEREVGSYGGNTKET